MSIRPLRVPIARRSLAIACATCAVLLTSSYAAAQNGPPDGGPHGWGPPGGGPPPGGPNLMMGALMDPQLGLTADQQAAIKTIFENNKEQIESDRSGERAAREALATYVKGGGSDAGTIQSDVDKISTAGAALTTDETNVFVSAYATLTSEQKATLASLPSGPPDDSGQSTSSGDSSDSSASSSSSRARRQWRH